MDDLADRPFCYLTTSGRLSWRPHVIEIWFALRDRWWGGFPWRQAASTLLGALSRRQSGK
jgi:hypothetical protein